MICADVPTLARAAPEPTTAQPKAVYGDGGESFDKFLQTVKTERPAGSDSSAQSRSSERKTEREDSRADQDNPVDTKPVNEKTVERKSTSEKQVDQKSVKDKKPEDLSANEETGQAEAAEKSAEEAAMAVLIAQAAAVVAPVIQQVEAVQTTGEAVETAVAPAAAQIPQNAQTPVIELPETEPQPLPDELKQALQQPKVEVKDFQNLVDAASQNLEGQTSAVDTTAKTAVMAATVDDAAEVKTMGTQEPAVKVVDITAQPDDVAEMTAARNTAGVYATTNTRAENLVQPKALPIIQKVSTQVAEMVREQSQSMRLQIHPENLGKIDLRLVSNSDGMRVVMTAEVPATAKLLETHLDQLQQSLSHAGVSISGMSVNSQGAQGQSANASQNQSQNMNRSVTTSFQPETETVSPVSLSVSSSGLDYRV